jgi:hypothetical protein
MKRPPGHFRNEEQETMDIPPSAPSASNEDAAAEARPVDRRAPLRIQFEDRSSLLEGFARAQEESWIDYCYADLAGRTLELRLAPHSTVLPAQASSWLERMRRIAGHRF